MKYRIFSYFEMTAILLVVALSSFGNPVDEFKALSVAKNFYSNLNHRSVESMHSGMVYKSSFRDSNTTAFYVVNFDDEGFVIVAGDDKVRPILAFSTEGAFVSENIPENVQFFLNGYADEIKYEVENQTVVNKDVLSQWTALIENNIIEYRDGNVVVGPLIGNNKWNQTSPYNKFCPATSGGNSAYGGHAAVGCAAIVMGQVIRYWQYPTTGIGTYSYTSNYGTLSVNYGATTYDYANMPNNLSSSSSVEQDNAVATLLYHCGVSVNMNYGANASSANSNYMVVALSRNFGYPETIEYHERGSLSATSWISHLTAELDERAPFFYGGSGSYGGHVWLCDGYRDDDYFHFNWGWGGTQNGYYTITNCSSYGFNSNHAVIVGIRGPRVPYTIATSNYPITGGTVTGAQVYFENETATLVAIPKANLNYTFQSWTENGDVVSTDSVYSFVVTSDRTLVANFVKMTSVEEAETEVKIYPNPTSDKIQINLNDSFALNNVRCELYDYSGKLIMSSNMTNTNQEIDLSSFAKGVYLLNIVDGDKIIVTQKIVKE